MLKARLIYVLGRLAQMIGVLWVIATGLGQDVRRAAGEGGDLTSGRAAAMHWLRTLTVLALLVLMIWKPGA